MGGWTKPPKGKFKGDCGQGGGDEEGRMGGRRERRREQQNIAKGIWMAAGRDWEEMGDEIVREIGRSSLRRRRFAEVKGKFGG